MNEKNKNNIIKRNKNNNKIKKKTFVIRTDYADRRIVEKLFNRKYWRYVPNKQIDKVDYIDFVYVDGKAQWDKRFWEKEIGVFSALDNSKYSVADKSELYNNFVETSPKMGKKYMMKQYDIDLMNNNNKKELFNTDKYKKLFNNNNNDKDNLWIVKPVYGFKGSGIAVVNNYKDLVEHLTKDREKTILQRYQDSEKWVISKYIRNPLLINGKKFHIRMILMYFVNNDKGSSRGFLFKEGVIFSAKKKYSNSNYEDKEIHDSHRVKGEEITFPNEFKEIFGKEKTDNVTKDIVKIANVIFKILKNNGAKCFPLNKNCFHLFGMDIMIDENFNTKLIECNSKIGLSGYPNIEQYFRNIIDIIVGDLYPETL